MLFITGQTKVTTLDSHWNFLVSIETSAFVGLAVNLLVWPMTAIRTSIERRVLLSDSLQEFADWLAAQTASSSPATDLASEQRSH